MKRWIHASEDVKYDLAKINSRMKYLKDVLNRCGSALRHALSLSPDKRIELYGDVDNKVFREVLELYGDKVATESNSLRACIAVVDDKSGYMKIADKGEWLFAATDYTDYQNIINNSGYSDYLIYTVYKGFEDALYSELVHDFSLDDALMIKPVKEVINYIDNKGFDLSDQPAASSKIRCVPTQFLLDKGLDRHDIELLSNKVSHEYFDKAVIEFYPNPTYGVFDEMQTFNNKLLIPLLPKFDVNTHVIDEFFNSVIKVYSKAMKTSQSAQSTQEWPTKQDWYNIESDEEFENMWESYLSAPEDVVNQKLKIFPEPSIQGGMGTMFIHDESGRGRDNNDYPWAEDYQSWCDWELNGAASSRSASGYQKKYRQHIKELCGI